MKCISSERGEIGGKEGEEEGGKGGEEEEGKDLLSKDPFERPAGDPPAFRGTLVLRDCKELARRF